MNDQTIPDMTDDDRRLARKWAAHIIRTPRTSLPMETAAARAILHAMPAAPRPTLADMTSEEQGECAGMQADLAQGDRVVILDGTPDSDDSVQVLEMSLGVFRPRPADVIPRPDLPRLEWPGEQQPAPALPGGWRLADHRAYGRVIVTSAAPDTDGYVYFVSSATGPIGNDWHLCPPAELTYLDTGQEAEGVAPARVGDTIESADDPRIDSLPAGSILCDLDGDDMEKTATGEWDAEGITIESPGCGPWTVHRIGGGADQ